MLDYKQLIFALSLTLGMAFNPTPTWAVTPQQAAHFLNQATFGATLSDINALATNDNLENWINNQANVSPSRSQESYVRERQPEVDGDLNAIDTWTPSRHDQWWATIVDGDDQLRHRMAWALSQIFVVSARAPALADSQYGLAHYYDMLATQAFGNFRQLLEQVTLHPAMGLYLSMLRNEKADPTRHIRPDENYAREIMQLFTIGTHQLNLDGSLKVGADGQALPTYDEAHIKEFAQVFTGWNFANINWDEWWGEGDRTQPMVAHNAYHDTSTKLLINHILPANQTPQQDLSGALDDLFLHPNVGPFFSKQLIQRFVTSNPSPAYIARVAKVFNNDGSVQAIRGNLLAVIEAILLDDEALNGAHNLPTTFGKLREPVIRLAHVLRAFKAIKVDGGEWFEYPGTYIYRFPYADNYELEASLGQTLLRAPSVFNFYLPDYSPPGITRNHQLLAPEFQINTENIQTETARIINTIIQAHAPDDEYPTSVLDINAEITIATSNLDDLLDRLNLILLNGTMSSSLRQTILSHLNDSSFTAIPEGLTFNGITYQRAEWQTRDAISLITQSPEYLIQR